MKRARASALRRRAVAVALMTALGASLAPAIPTASAAEKMVVHTKSGDTIVGDLVEMTEDRVVIRLSSGEERVIPMSEVAVFGGGTPMTTQFPDKPSEPQPSPDVDEETQEKIDALKADNPIWGIAPSYHGSDAVDLRIDFEGELSLGKLYAAVDGTSRWEPICNAPCSMKVDPHRTYKVGGIYMEDSPPFHLRSRGEREVLEVDATAAGTRAIGWTFTLLGAAMSGIGLYWFTQAPSGSDDEAHSHRVSDHIGGGVLMGVGLPFLISGIAVLLSPGTTVTDKHGNRLASLGPTAVPLGDSAWLTPRGIVF